MRLLTGAILILASAIILLITQIERSASWIIYYHHGLLCVGIFFLAWGFVRDLSISMRRWDRRESNKR